MTEQELINEITTRSIAKIKVMLDELHAQLTHLENMGLEDLIQERNELRDLFKLNGTVKTPIKELIPSYTAKKTVAKKTARSNVRGPGAQITKRDQALLGFIKLNPGASRADIDGRYGKTPTTKKAVENGLARLRKRGLIKSQGNTNGAKWFVVETKK